MKDLVQLSFALACPEKSLAARDPALVSGDATYTGVAQRGVILWNQDAFGGPDDSQCPGIHLRGSAQDRFWPARLF